MAVTDPEHIAKLYFCLLCRLQIPAPKYNLNIHSFILSNCLILVKVTVGLEPT